MDQIRGVPRHLEQTDSIAAVIQQLITAGELFYSRNWVLGTAGNFSAIVSRQPFELIITASGTHKGFLSSRDFLQIDQSGRSSDPRRRPSAETLIHRTIIAEQNAGAVLNTHSVWSTILSDLYAESGGIPLNGFEMLKGLSRIKTHEQMEWLPILENSRDYEALGQAVRHVLRTNPEVHGILLRKHGLYTWGSTIAEAMRHVEVFEFLLEVICRQLHIFSQFNKEPHDNRIYS